MEIRRGPKVGESGIGGVCSPTCKYSVSTFSFLTI